MRGLQIGMFALGPVRSVLVVGPLLEIGKTSLLMSRMIHQLGVKTVGRLWRAQNREWYSRYVMEHSVIEREAFATTVVVVVVHSSRSSNSSGTTKKNLRKCIVLIFKAVSYQSTRLGQYQAEL